MCLFASRRQPSDVVLARALQRIGAAERRSPAYERQPLRDKYRFARSFSIRKDLVWSWVGDSAISECAGMSPARANFEGDVAAEGRSVYLVLIATQLRDW